MTEEAKVEQTESLPTFVVESRMKDYIKSKGLHSTGDLLEELNRQVGGLIDAAIRRCKQNNRSTVQQRDF